MAMAPREPRFTKDSFVLLEWGIVAVFLLLLSGFWRLQILQPDYYSHLAERNAIKSLPIPAPRGRIVDRNNRVMVDNYPGFTILGQSEAVQALQEHVPAIAAGLDVDSKELSARVESLRRKSPYGPIVLRENATRQDIAFIESHRSEFPELDIVLAHRRLYPSDGFGAHLLGYVGEVSEGDLDLPEMAVRQPGDTVGKSGIEREYDDLLRGEDGERRVVVDSLGREMASFDDMMPTAGRDLRLTIDADLQAVAEAGFQGAEGALVALDPRTGEVLALVSRPAFDPNLFASGISRQDWSQLTTDASNPLLNRAIQAQLAPGSVYKIVMATAGLESGVADATTAFYCPGGATFYGRYFQCWEKKGHGRVDIHRALVQSCDVFFYTLGKNLGIDQMAKYSKLFGLGRPTGIDLPHEESGTVPSPEWKEKNFRQKWYAGETISVAVGQGALTVTPVQVAYSVGGIASGGRFMRPHLVFSDELAARGRTAPEPGQTQVPLNEETVTVVTDGLYGVVNEGGTGGRARIPGLDVAGKTGTAQTVSLEGARNARQSGVALKDNAWFVGLAPRRNPEIVVAVLYESGEHGSLAAPLARDVIKAYFDKKNGVPPKLPKPEPHKDMAVSQPAQAPEG